MRVLVTGGAGFIGSHVVDRLVALEHEVVVLDNLDSQVHGERVGPPANLEEHLLAGRIDFRRGDVRDRRTVAEALRGVDAVVHLAAAVGVGQSMYQPFYYADVNVAGQARLLEEMARGPGRVRRLVVASSMSIYGEGAGRCAEHGAVAPPARADARLARGEWEVPCPRCGRPLAPIPTPEDTPLRAQSVYAITKQTQEELALCFGRAYGIPTIALRFFNVYGSRQALSNPYTGVAAIFLARLLNGRPPLLFEDGRQSRDFVHVRDAAEAVVRALSASEEVSGAFNVCTGRPVTIRELAEVLAERVGARIAPRVIGRHRSGDIRHCVGDPARARAALGFEAREDFRAGIDELVAWSTAQEARDRVEASLAELERQRLVR